MKTFPFVVILIAFVGQLSIKLQLIIVIALNLAVYGYVLRPAGWFSLKGKEVCTHYVAEIETHYVTGMETLHFHACSCCYGYDFLAVSVG